MLTTNSAEFEILPKKHSSILHKKALFFLRYFVNNIDNSSSLYLALSTSVEVKGVIPVLYLLKISFFILSSISVSRLGSFITSNSNILIFEFQNIS